jgi:hypothetical protein
MSLTGSACLAIWNDVEPAREAEYNLWHTSEHVPERCGVPGILEARRYVAPDRDRHRYFTLYDLRDLEVLASPPYRDLVESPTPWSAAMRPAFRNFLREPCEILAAGGVGIGGAAATFRFSLVRDAEPVSAEAARRLVAGFHERLTPCAICLGAVTAADAHPLAGGIAPEMPVDGPRYLLVVEAAARAALELEQAEIVRATTNGLSATDVTAKIYDLALVVRHPGSGPRAAGAVG